MARAISTRSQIYELVRDALERFEGNGDHRHFIDWDNSEVDTDPGGHHHFHSYLTDECKRFWWELEERGEVPMYISPEHSAARAAHEASDSDEEFYWDEDDGDEWTELRTDVVCCIRAGADVGASPSAGVVGYSLGTLRAMWPKGLPKWVTAFFQDGEKLAESPDETPVWL